MIILPQEYLPVEYIRSTGTQYIVLPHCHNQKTWIDIEMSINRIYSYNTFIGAGTSDNSADTMTFGIYSGALNLDFGTGIGVSSPIPWIDNNLRRYRFKFNFRKCFIEDEDYHLGTCLDINGVPNTTVYNTSLFIRNLANTFTSEKGEIALYRCKIYNGVLDNLDKSKLEFDLIPCIRKIDSKPGLYDQVSGVFYVNNGTGEFELPPSRIKVEEHPNVGKVYIEPDYKELYKYDQVEYIESNGNQYIDTYLRPDSDWTLEYKFARIDTTTSTATLWCSRGSYNTLSYTTFLISGTGIRADYNAKTDATQIPVTDTDIHTLKRAGNKLYLDNNLVQTDTEAWFVCGNYIRFFASYYNGMTANIGDYAKIRCYEVKVWNGDNKLVGHFVPAVNNYDDIPGLFDLVNKEFHANTTSNNNKLVYGDKVGELEGREAHAISNERNEGYYKNIQVTAVANPGYDFKSWKLKDYTRIKYIEGTGNQRIDTGLTTTTTMRIDFDFEICSTDTGSVFGSSWDGRALLVRTSGRNLIVYWGNSPVYVPYEPYHRATLRYNYQAPTTYGRHEYDGKVYSSGGTFDRHYQLRLMWSSDYYCKERIYGCKIYDRDSKTGDWVLLRDYIPVLRKDGVAGLLDIINYQFYTNGNGTNNFVCGGVLDERA